MDHTLHPPTTPASAVATRGLRKTWPGGVEAVAGIDFEVPPGEVFGLLGPNGAGKSTTLKVASGQIRANAGEVLLDGVSTGKAGADELARRGLCLVPEGRGVFPNLTVTENLRMATYAGTPLRTVLDRAFTRFPRLAERRKQLAGTLSGGEQQMLAMARALMAQPKLLLLDEPSMGLAPLMVEKIFEIIADIARQGVTILLVEQNARLALEFAGRGYVMESGAISLAGEAKVLLADPRVREAYLGESAAG